MLHMAIAISITMICKCSYIRYAIPSLYWLVDAKRDPRANERRSSWVEFFPVKFVQRAAFGNSSCVLGVRLDTDDCTGKPRTPDILDSPTFRLLEACVGTEVADIGLDVAVVVGVVSRVGYA